MRTIPRYVLAEVIKVFLVTLTGLTLFTIIFLVVREAKSLGLGPAQILMLIPYSLPGALRITVPATILFAACSVFGRMSGANEIVALKSSGISPVAVLMPVFVAAVLLSVLSVWLNDADSWGRDGARRIVVESAEEIVYSWLRTQKSYSSKQFSIIVQDVDDRRLIQPVISFQASADSQAVTISADEAEIRSDADAQTLTLRFRNYTIESGTVRASDSGVQERIIPLDDNSRAALSPQLMPLNMISSEIARQRQSIDRFQEDWATRGAMDMLTGRFDDLASPAWQSYSQVLHEMNNHLHRLQTEPWRRWANGFSCLCFVLVGAPLAIRLRNSDVATTFFLCFFPILLVYYPLLMFGSNQAKSGTWPPYCVWTGNVILCVWGAWLIRRVLRF